MVSAIFFLVILLIAIIPIFTMPGKRNESPADFRDTSEDETQREKESGSDEIAALNKTTRDAQGGVGTSTPEQKVTRIDIRQCSHYKEALKTVLNFSIPVVEIPENLGSRDKAIREGDVSVPVQTTASICKDASAIQVAINARKIEQCFHFTRIENIKNIMSYGLLSRRKLRSMNIHTYYNDYNRYDNVLDGICISISWPNYKMLYSLMMKNPEYRWVIIEISPKILYEKKCLFNETNAAKKRCSSINRRDRQGISAFTKLFYNGDVSKYPIDPQAEVLCLNDIELSYFNRFYVQDYKSLMAIERYSSRVAVEFNQCFFAPRFDYKEWNNGRASSVYFD